MQFLVSGRDLACQQDVSLALTETPPVHYYNVVDSAFSNYWNFGTRFFKNKEISWKTELSHPWGIQLAIAWLAFLLGFHWNLFR